MSGIDCIINMAKSYIGVKEGTDRHRNIIDLYNKAKYGDAYKMTMTDPWCAAFVVAVFQACSMADIIPCYAACDQMISVFKSWGRWHKSNGFSVNAGDIIFYNWNGDAVSDHVGIVVQNQFGDLTVVEGNMNDDVGYRKINITNASIMGYGRPNYAKSGIDSSVEHSSPYQTLNSCDKSTINKLPLLYVSSSGVAVKLLQILLSYNMKKALSIDGIFGSETEEVVRNWQSVNNLEVDGICGKETWSSLIA